MNHTEGATVLLGMQNNRETYSTYFYLCTDINASKPLERLADLTLCVPYIIPQCVNDQQDAQFL